MTFGLSISMALLMGFASLVNADTAPSAIVSAEILPGHVLPGIYPTVKLTVTNASGEPLQLDGSVRLLVTGPNGAQFAARRPGPDSTGAAGLGNQATDPIPAKAAREYFLETFDASCFGDPRLTTPGRYDLQFEIRDAFGNAFRSNDVSFVVDQPQGDDAAVWKLLSSGPEGASYAVAFAMNQQMLQSIFAAYSDSMYVPYLVRFYRTSDADVAEKLFLFALSRPIPSAYAAELKVALVRTYGASCRAEIHRFNLDRALSFRSKALELAGSMRDSSFPFAAQAAAQVLDDLPTEDQIRWQFNDYIKQHSAVGGVSGGIVPFVQCVDKGTAPTDDLAVVFGYTNPNRATRYVSSGPGNRVEPEGVAQVPVAFDPGQHSNAAFAVVDPKASVTWSVDGAVATASVKSTTLCVPPASPKPVTPLLDCVEKDGKRLVGTFGYVSANAAPIRIRGTANAAIGTGHPPTVFLPGEHHGVFRLEGTTEQPPSWTLNAVSIAASGGGILCDTSEEDQQHD